MLFSLSNIAGPALLDYTSFATQDLKKTKQIRTFCDGANAATLETRVTKMADFMVDFDETTRKGYWEQKGKVLESTRKLKLLDRASRILFARVRVNDILWVALVRLGCGVYFRVILY